MKDYKIKVCFTERKARQVSPKFSLIQIPFPVMEQHNSLMFLFLKMEAYVLIRFPVQGAIGVMSSLSTQKINQFLKTHYAILNSVVFHGEAMRDFTIAPMISLKEVALLQKPISINYTIINWARQEIRMPLYLE